MSIAYGEGDNNTLGQAIADISGYENPEMQAWGRACVAAHAALTQPGGILAGAEATRVARGLDLARAGSVQIEGGCVSIKSGGGFYTWEEGAACPCADHARYPQIPCKHMVAAHIVAAIPGHGTPATPQEEERVPQSEKSEMQHMHIENPAGAVLKFRMGRNEIWYTLHDASDEALLGRLEGLLPRLQALVEAYEVPQYEKPASPAPAPAPAPEADQSWCKKHQTRMRWHAGNDRGPGWYSHQLEGGSYCRGRT